MCTSSLNQWLEATQHLVDNGTYILQILHVLTASLKHAQMVLMAAMQAGFRESGAINLVHSAHEPMPMVGIRCVGLSFDSIIGCLHQGPEAEHHSVWSLVAEDYLHTLTTIANERFAENAKRTENFRARLLHLFQTQNQTLSSLGTGRTEPSRAAWEDAACRRERKRAEGLKRKQELHEMKAAENRGTM